MDAKQYSLHDYDSATEMLLAYPVVERLLGCVYGKRILDFGCGHGKFSRRLSERRAIVTGVDRSKDAITLAKASDRRSTYLHTPDLSGLAPIKTGTLDYVVANFVFCCMETADEMGGTTECLAHKLRPGGRLIICDPHPQSPGHRYKSFFRERPPSYVAGAPVRVHLSGMSETITDYWHSEQEYLGALDAAGLRLVAKLSPVASRARQGMLEEKRYPPFLVLCAER